MDFHKHIITVLLLFTIVQAYTQVPVIANFDESKVVPYTLPDALKTAKGKNITTVKQWEKQRKYWLNQFSENMYGFTPTQKIKLHFELVETKTDALNNMAIRKRVNIYFTDSPALKPIELILYVPKAAKKPVPVFVSLNFIGNQSINNETDIPISHKWFLSYMDKTGKAIVNNRANENSRGLHARRWPLEAILARGYAVATACCADIEEDRPDGWKTGIRSVLGDTTQTNNWGCIGAWAWGMSRILDYLENEQLVDATKAVALGHSRLGKTALWAAAQDSRFAMAISNNSGDGGAALSRRNFGESFAYYQKQLFFWYCKNYTKYTYSVSDLPFDQHILLSLIAPRPLYIASASEDLMADPKGEFLSAVNSSSVYALYNMKGLATTVLPGVEKPIGERIGYHIRKGEHDILLYDWERFMDFADKMFSKRAADIAYDK